MSMFENTGEFLTVSRETPCFDSVLDYSAERYSVGQGAHGFRSTP